MSQQITNEQVQQAAAAGVQVLTGESPLKFIDQLMLLRHILSAVAQGELVILKPPAASDGAPAKVDPPSEQQSRPAKTKRSVRKKA